MKAIKFAIPVKTFFLFLEPYSEISRHIGAYLKRNISIPVMYAWCDCLIFISDTWSTNRQLLSDRELMRIIDNSFSSHDDMKYAEVETLILFGGSHEIQWVNPSARGEAR